MDKLAAAYAEMMAQTEHTVQLLLDPKWQGADAVSRGCFLLTGCRSNYEQDEERLREEEEAEARRREEAERQRALERARREAEERIMAGQTDKERKAREAASKSVRGVRGMRGSISRGRGRGEILPEKGTSKILPPVNHIHSPDIL